jgi:hypothetical protein
VELAAELAVELAVELAAELVARIQVLNLGCCRTWERFGNLREHRIPPL